MKIYISSGIDVLFLHSSASAKKRRGKHVTWVFSANVKQSFQNTWHKCILECPVLGPYVSQMKIYCWSLMVWVMTNAALSKMGCQDDLSTSSIVSNRKSWSEKRDRKRGRREKMGRREESCSINGSLFVHLMHRPDTYSIWSVTIIQRGQ